MKQLIAISEFLIGLNLVAAEQIDPWADQMKITPAGTSKGAGGTIIFRNEYVAVIFIERYPHKVHSPNLLWAHISAWLMDNDGDRFDQRDASIKIEVDILDDETADVMISIDFIEEVGIVEDSGGDIRLDGKYWRLDEPEIYYALSGELKEPVEWIGEQP